MLWSPLLRSAALAGLALFGAVPVAGAAEDPQAVVLAEGAQRYRQSDLDSLMLIARRHLGRPFQGDEEQVLRTSLLAMLLAREPLLAETAKLPPAFTAAQRDRLLLDVLDYRADPGTGTPGGAPSNPAPDATAAPTTMLELPIIDLQRPKSDGTMARLQAKVALAIPSASADALRQKLLLVQDAVLGHLHGLERGVFASLDLEGTRNAIRQGLAKATAGQELEHIQVLITEFVAP